MGGLVRPGITIGTFGDGGGADTMQKLNSGGGNHNVFKTTFNGKDVVLKKFEFSKKGGELAFRKEALMLKKLSHPNVIKLEGVIFETSSVAYIQLSYYAGGDMRLWLERSPQPTPVQKQAVLHQVCRGIEYREYHVMTATFSFFFFFLILLETFQRLEDRN